MNKVGEARPGCFGYCFKVSCGKSNINRFTAYGVNYNMNFNEARHGRASFV